MNTYGIIILAAGKGERMGGAYPKVLFELGGKPLIGHVLETAYRLHPGRIVVVAGFGKDLVIDYVTKHAVSHSVTNYKDSEPGDDTPGIDIRFAVQEPQLGTGHAVLQTESMFMDFHGNILILSGDVPLISSETLISLLEFHTSTGAGTTVLTADYKNPEGYGRIVFEKTGDLLRIVEDKDAVQKEKEITIINSGMFVFQAQRLFKYLSKITRDNAQTEYYITDLVRILREHDIKVTAWQTSHPEETYGVNTPDQLTYLNNLLSSQ